MLAPRSVDLQHAPLIVLRISLIDLHFSQRIIHEFSKILQILLPVPMHMHEDQYSKLVFTKSALARTQSGGTSSESSMACNELGLLWHRHDDRFHSGLHEMQLIVRASIGRAEGRANLQQLAVAGKRLYGRRLARTALRR